MENIRRRFGKINPQCLQFVFFIDRAADIAFNIDGQPTALRRMQLSLLHSFPML